MITFQLKQDAFSRQIRMQISLQDETRRSKVCSSVQDELWEEKYFTMRRYHMIICVAFFVRANSSNVANAQSEL